MRVRLRRTTSSALAAGIGCAPRTIITITVLSIIIISSSSSSRGPGLPSLVRCVDRSFGARVRRRMRTLRPRLARRASRSHFACAGGARPRVAGAERAEVQRRAEEDSGSVGRWPGPGRSSGRLGSNPWTGCARQVGPTPLAIFVLPDVRGARGEGQMGSALIGSLQVSCFLTEGLFGYSR